VIGANLSVSGGVLRITSSKEGLISKTVSAGDVAVEAKYRMSSGSRGSVKFRTTLTDTISYGRNDCYDINFRFPDSDENLRYWTEGAHFDLATATYTYTADVWYRAFIAGYGDTLKGRVADDAPLLEATHSKYASGEVGVGTALLDTEGTDYVEFDWVFVRNYIDPEPTHGAWGAEEVSSITGANYITQSFPASGTRTANLTVDFYCTVTFYDVPKNASVRIFNATDDSLVTVIWNSTPLQNGTPVKIGSYTFSYGQTYKWDCVYYNASGYSWKSSGNWTITPGTIRIAYFSDLHIGETSDVDKTTFVNAMNNLNPDYIVSLGDFVQQENLANPETDDSFYNEYINDILLQLNNYDDDRVIHVLGGHDGWTERCSYYNGYFRLLNETSDTYVTKIGNIAFVVTPEVQSDSINWRYLTEAIYDWVDSKLRELEEQGYNVILLDHAGVRNTTAYTWTWYGYNDFPESQDYKVKRLQWIASNYSNIVVMLHGHVHVDPEEVDDVGRDVWFNPEVDTDPSIYSDIDMHIINIAAASTTMHSNQYVDYITIWYTDIQHGRNEITFKAVRASDGSIRKTITLPVKYTLDVTQPWSEEYMWEPAQVDYPNIKKDADKDYKWYIPAGSTSTSIYKFRYMMPTLVEDAEYFITNYDSISIEIAYSDTGAWDDYSQWYVLNGNGSILGAHEYWKLRVTIVADSANQAEIYYIRLKQRTTSAILLPNETMYLTHSLVYSPISTQFTHTFTASNTTTANYETDYEAPYGWRVYAEPYQSGGTDYENTATLISEVDITLPYTEVLVENLTLLARDNGTGAYRQLWIKVLNSTSDVVAEITNVTIGTDWTDVPLVVNANLSGQVTIWINATVKSTATAGEEIAIKDVRVFVKHETNPQVEVEFIAERQFYNCTASHNVELGSSSYLNSSVVIFKLIEYLEYNKTGYPVQATYLGNETIDSRLYRVYKVEPANYSQLMTIYALMENRFRTFRMHVKGYETQTVLVGEPFTIDLPATGNVTIIELNKVYINVLSVTMKFPTSGVFTIIVNASLPQQWILGYATRAIHAKYGSLSIRLLDIDSKEIDYLSLELQLINKTDGSVAREITGNKLLSLDNLAAGNYTVKIKLDDIVVGLGDLELNITTDASTFNQICNIKGLVNDYRGLNKTVIGEYDKQLVGVENLNSKYPYSSIRVALNGSGNFKLYINYGGDKPTRISVVANVTNLDYYWDGNYLVIEGILGSVGELNITDLYRLRIEVYNRRNELMPSWMYVFINNTKYLGSVVEDYRCPSDYEVRVPETIKSFDFYGFWDNFNETVRTISINHTDVTHKAWYRIPSNLEIEVKSVGGSQFLSWLFSLLQQNTDKVQAYVEGNLRDYYGRGVPNRLVAVEITNLDTEYTMQLNATTDVSGYFRTDAVKLVQGKQYEVKVIYQGDDIYVETISTKYITLKAPAAPVEVIGIPTEYIVAIVIAIVIVVAVAIFAWKAAKHVIHDEFAKRRKFVKRKK